MRWPKWLRRKKMKITKKEITVAQLVKYLSEMEDQTKSIVITLTEEDNE